MVDVPKNLFVSFTKQDKNVGALVCVFFVRFPDRQSCWGDSLRQKLSESKWCVFFVRNGDYDSSMLKFEHKRYLMEKDDIIVEIVLSAYYKALYSCVDS